MRKRTKIGETAMQRKKHLQRKKQKHQEKLSLETEAEKYLRVEECQNKDRQQQKIKKTKKFIMFNN